MHFFRTCLCVCVCVVIEYEVFIEMQQQNAQHRQKKKKKKKKTHFARFRERPLSESAASESVSSGIWKMSCMDSFQALFPN